MLQITPFEKHVEEYEAWFEKYPAVFQSEIMAIRQQMRSLPEKLTGLEVGTGTGRYAEALGIKEGVEPAEEMAKRAVRRGVEVINARAEKLPYRDIHFDLVLFVTICHLDSVPEAFEEAYRVLKPGGTIIIGFLDEKGAVAQAYEARRHWSTFYRNATFYSVGRVEKILKDVGFRNMNFSQTLFNGVEEIEEVQDPKEGFGEGSFVVVKAEK